MKAVGNRLPIAIGMAVGNSPFLKGESSALRNRGMSWIILFFTFLILNSCYSQNVIATAELDTNAILIGKQAKIKLTIQYKTERSKIEKFIPDSSDMSHLAQSQTIIITSFDSGYYAIPPFKFIVNGDSNKAIQTEPLLFSVNTIAVDTTIAIKDIKPPLEVPFNWRELLPYIYAGLAGLAVLAGIIYFIIYYLKKRKKKPMPEIIIPKIPPHVTAFERLEKLKEEKLWQAGKLKEYHSELSDIIRQYIEHRFFINAMEQVTDEIMYSFRTVDLSDELKAKLRNVLFLSDLVKFAKEQPLPNENESSWNNAHEFVSETKKEIKEESYSLKGDNDNNSLQGRGKTDAEQ